MTTLLFNLLIAVLKATLYNMVLEKEVIYIHDRIKELRQALQLSQQEFADRLKVTQGTVSGYEIGRRAPADAIILSICREFHVNEKWLRTGEGPMFRAETKEQKLFTALGDIAMGPDNFKRRFIAALAEMPEENWEALLRLVQTVSATLDDDRDPADPDPEKKA